MSRKQPEVHKKRLLKALKKHRGLIVVSCKEVGITRQTYYKYYTTDPLFKEAVDEINETQGDHVEDQLFNLIDSGNPAAIMFYLRYKGRNRGYANTIDITATEPIQIRYIQPNAGDKGEV